MALKMICHLFNNYNMKKILLLALVIFPVLMQAQRECVDVENDDVLKKGTVRLMLEHDPMGGAYSKFGLWDDYDDQFFFLSNIGVGAEYLYKTRRSIGVSVHANYLDPIGSFDPAPLYDTNMYNITAGVMHRWYVRRWMFGAGLSFEKRSLKYKVYEPKYDINPEPYIYDWGETGFVNNHYNLGPDLMVGWSWGNHKWYVGVQHSLRFILKDKVNYKEPIVNPVKIKNREGCIDQQFSFIIRYAFSIGKK